MPEISSMEIHNPTARNSQEIGILSRLQIEKNTWRNIAIGLAVSLAVCLIVFAAQSWGARGGNPSGELTVAPHPTLALPPIPPYFSIAKAAETTSKCTGIIKKTLATHASELVKDNIGARIGQVLGAQFSWTDTSGDFYAECCGKGTEYDHFLMTEVEIMKKDEFLNGVNANTMLIMVDMQKDFATGSFGQPCWPEGGDSFSTSMADLAKTMAMKGATIVATKDYHPADHCSFDGTCKNRKDYTHLNFTAEQRYVNFFPSHCGYTVKDDQTVPLKGMETPFCKNTPGASQLPFCADATFSGSAFIPQIDAVMSELKKTKAGQVEIVFKGMHKSYDSFSAIPHLNSKDKVEQEKTGGYALSAKRKEDCFQAESFEDPACLPKASEFEDSQTMRSLLSIIKSKSIKKIVTVGLVYDFCVKETAIFAKEWDEADKSVGFESIVLGDLTRPSFDGKPGAPFVKEACDGGQAQGEFCLKGGGTTRSHAAVYEDYEANHVKVLRLDSYTKEKDPVTYVQSYV